MLVFFEFRVFLYFIQFMDSWKKVMFFGVFFSSEVVRSKKIWSINVGELIEDLFENNIVVKNSFKSNIFLLKSYLPIAFEV